MDTVKQLTKAIFSQYQEDPVPIDTWIRKVDDAQIVIALNRGVLLYHERLIEPQHLTFPRVFQGFLETKTPLETKNPSESAQKKSIHIWLCGVLPEYQKMGVATSMLRRMLYDIKNRGKNYPIISTHINKKKFPEMVLCLEHLGFKLVGFVEGKSLERYEIETNELIKKLEH